MASIYRARRDDGFERDPSRNGGPVGDDDYHLEGDPGDQHEAELAGALSMTEYRHGLENAEFTEITIQPTHEVADGIHSAIIRAVKPADTPTVASTAAAPTRTTAKSCC